MTYHEVADSAHASDVMRSLDERADVEITLVKDRIYVFIILELQIHLIGYPLGLLEEKF